MKAGPHHLLAITSSQMQLGFSIRVGEHTHTFEVNKEKGRRGEQLYPEIQSTLKTLNLLPKDLQALIVDTGPGSYTGLRTGLSFINGLAFALEIPVYSYSSLHMVLAAAAKQINTKPLSLRVGIYAGKQEVYTAVFKQTGDHYSLEDQPEMVSFSEFRAQNLETCVLRHDMFDPTPFSQVDISASLLIDLFLGNVCAQKNKGDFAKPDYVRMMDIKIKNQALL